MACQVNSRGTHRDIPRLPVVTARGEPQKTQICASVWLSVQQCPYIRFGTTGATEGPLNHDIMMLLIKFMDPHLALGGPLPLKYHRRLLSGDSFFASGPHAHTYHNTVPGTHHDRFLKDCINPTWFRFCKRFWLFRQPGPCVPGNVRLQPATIAP